MWGKTVPKDPNELTCIQHLSCGGRFTFNLLPSIRIYKIEQYRVSRLLQRAFELRDLATIMGENYAFIGKEQCLPPLKYFILTIVGLGAMGFAMAGNIRQKIPSSSTLYVYDVFQPTCERFVDEFKARGRVEIVKSPKEAASRAGVIISIVPTGNNVRQVYLDEKEGVIAGPKNPNRIILECSTIDSATARDVGEALMKADAGLYTDTPVSVS